MYCKLETNNVWFSARKESNEPEGEGLKYIAHTTRINSNTNCTYGDLD